MTDPIKIKMKLHFYEIRPGKAPAREWLLELNKGDRRKIGRDLYTVQTGWPVGMPLVRPLGDGLWEVRSSLRDNIARTLFIIFTYEESSMVILHGFIKKTQKTPPGDRDLALARAKDFKRQFGKR